MRPTKAANNGPSVITAMKNPAMMSSFENPAGVPDPAGNATSSFRVRRVRDGGSSFRAKAKWAVSVRSRSMRASLERASPLSARDLRLLMRTGIPSKDEKGAGLSGRGRGFFSCGGSLRRVGIPSADDNGAGLSGRGFE